MSATLALQISPGEVWAALEENGALLGLRVAREGDADIVGGVFLGRVVALRPELPAALIDIGLDRPAFLDARDADKVHGIAGLTEGQALIVEARKAARADKAAGVRLLRADDKRHGAIAAAAREATPPARLDQPEPAVIRAAKPLLREGVRAHRHRRSRRAHGAAPRLSGAARAALSFTARRRRSSRRSASPSRSMRRCSRALRCRAAGRSSSRWRMRRR